MKVLKVIGKIAAILSAVYAVLFAVFYFGIFYQDLLFEVFIQGNVYIFIN